MKIFLVSQQCDFLFPYSSDSCSLELQKCGGGKAEPQHKFQIILSIHDFQSMIHDICFSHFGEHWKVLTQNGWSKLHHILINL